MPYRSRPFALALVATVCTFAATTFAGSRLATWSSTGTTWTAVSGVSGTNELTTLLDADETGKSFTYLYYREQNARPFQLVVKACQLETSSGKHERCLAEDMNLGSDAIGLYADNELDVGSGHYITAVQVCTNVKPNNTGEQEIKGIRLWGSTVQNDGTLRRNATAQEFKLLSCAKWHAKVACPDRTVSSGIKAYYSKAGFGGLALRCSPVSVNAMSRSRD